MNDPRGNRPPEDDPAGDPHAADRPLDKDAWPPAAGGPGRWPPAPGAPGSWPPAAPDTSSGWSTGPLDKDRTGDRPPARAGDRSADIPLQTGGWQANTGPAGDPQHTGGWRTGGGQAEDQRTGGWRTGGGQAEDQHTGSWPTGSGQADDQHTGSWPTGPAEGDLPSGEPGDGGHTGSWAAGETGSWPSGKAEPVDETPRPKLVGWLPMALGVLLIVLGAVWTLQGLNVLTDARMSGQDRWAEVGPGVALAGLILVVLGVQLRTRAKRRAAAEVAHP